MLQNFIFYKINKTFKIWLNNSAGRNFYGRICVHHRSSGHKKLYKCIDLQRKINCLGLVLQIQRSNFFTSYIAMILYQNGLISYCLISADVFIGDNIFSGYNLNAANQKNVVIQGSSLPLKYINLFTIVNCIESSFMSGFKYARSAGASAILIGKKNNNIIIKLKSGWLMHLSKDSMASVGRASNIFHQYDILKKAGSSRYFGIRPTVRGVVKNPCDHPHGGGEGKGSPPAAQVSPWGKLTKGTPTKNKRKDRVLRRLFKKL